MPLKKVEEKEKGIDMNRSLPARRGMKPVKYPKTRDRSPMERQRVIDRLKSEAKAIGGGFWTADEMEKLKGESQAGFDKRMKAKGLRGGGRAYGKNS